MPAVMLEPPLQIQILFRPSAASIEYQAGRLQKLPLLQIVLNQLLPIPGERERNPRVTISGKIYEIKRIVDTIKIDRLRATRCVAGESQPFLADQGIDQAGFSYVTSPQKSDFRQPVRGEILRLGRACYEFGFQINLEPLPTVAAL